MTSRRPSPDDLVIASYIGFLIIFVLLPLSACQGQTPDRTDGSER